VADVLPAASTSRLGLADVQVPMFRIITNEITLKGGWRYGNGD
jgi:hypothetical protein